MHINHIDDNNTNFKALKLNPQKMPALLQKKTIEYILFLNKLGEQYKDVNLYHVILEDSFVPKIIKEGQKDSKNYYQEFKEQEKHLGEFIYQTCGDETHGYSMPRVPFIFTKIFGENAKRRYENFKNMTPIEQAMELSRLLEKQELNEIAENKLREAEKLAEENAKLLQKKEHNFAIDNLIEKFKMETAQDSEKKGFFRRLFKF